MKILDLDDIVIELTVKKPDNDLRYEAIALKAQITISALEEYLK